jgi:hypothetical protein
MQKHHWITSLALATAALSCNPSRAPWSYQRPTTAPGDLLLETPEFTVPAGAEVTMCTYTTSDATSDIITRELRNYQAPGGHHVVLFYTTARQTPGVHECTEREMSNWRFIGGGQESQESALSLPPGIGIKIPAGAQLVLQSHYLNTTAAPARVRDALVIHPAAAGEVQNVVDSYNIYDPDLSIPPRSSYGRTLECAVEQDMRIVSVLGHTHGMGERVRISIVNGAGVERMIYNEQGGDRLQFSPPAFTFAEGGGLALQRGDRFRLICDWMNTSSETLEPPREMCASLMYYYPARGAVVCQNVVSTRGGAVTADAGADSGDSGPVGNRGCTTPPTPTDRCVRPCHRGNEKGVGRYCTASGGECGGLNAFVCTADVDTSGGPTFCTRPCTMDSQCGSGAVCTGDERGRGCVPIECAGSDADAGAGDAATDGGVTDGGAMDASHDG